MDTAKIRVKIGVHEFEAEGPAELVSQQFDSWKALIDSEAKQKSFEPPTPTVITPLSGTAQMAGSISAMLFTDSAEQLSRLYSLDDKRDLITLRVLPIGEDRHREALLLVLYGFLRLKNQDEIVVTKLKAALESSGSTPDRIDRTAEPYQREGYLVKGGMGKGGKYRLTNKGVTKAQEKVQELLAQLL
nr:hypothetical protein [Nitrosomonas nitrosa]